MVLDLRCWSQRKGNKKRHSRINFKKGIKTSWRNWKISLQQQSTIARVFVYAIKETIYNRKTFCLHIHHQNTAKTLIKMSTKQGNSKDLKIKYQLILEQVEIIEATLIYTTKEGKAYWRQEGNVIFKAIKTSKDHLLSL